MRDDDLRRRLEKLVALRDHPSTLPAIREEARRAEERLRTIIRKARQGATFLTSDFHDLKLSPVQEQMWEIINRETQKIWPKVKPAYPDDYS